MAKTTRSSGRAPAPHIPEEAAVSRSFIDEHGKSFDADPFNTVRQNAMAEADAGKLGLNQRVAMAVDRNFSTRIDDWVPTDQKNSGRCWLFAATNLLRVGAFELRTLHAAGRSDGELREVKKNIMGDVFTILRLHMGNPPRQFDWQWTDDKKKFHREAGLTPQSFVKKHVTLPLGEYVALVHDPRKSSPLGRTFTVEYLGNVVEGGIVTYLNVDIATMKEIAIKALKRGEAVWFGCDCGKMMHRELSVWDAGMFDFETLYGAPLELTSKEDRLLYKGTSMNHAMLFTGVENSWGDKGEGKGFYVMNDSWFDEHMFEIAARRSALPAKLRAALDQAPIALPAWDPMGSLAE
jgi:bleomycin hydrolase